MTNADERLYNLKRDNFHGVFANDDISFLIKEIDHREVHIELLLKELNKQIAKLPDWIVDIANEYGVDVNG